MIVHIVYYILLITMTLCTFPMVDDGATGYLLLGWLITSLYGYCLQEADSLANFIFRGERLHPQEDKKQLTKRINLLISKVNEANK